jgi:hypothetical protein
LEEQSALPSDNKKNNLSASLTLLSRSKTSSYGAGYTGSFLPEKNTCTNYLLKKFHLLVLTPNSQIVRSFFFIVFVPCTLDCIIVCLQSSTKQAAYLLFYFILV